MGALIGLSCVQPGNSALPIAMICLLGLGLCVQASYPALTLCSGSPLILIVSGVQFYAPHRLIGTVTALVTSARSVFIAVFVAIYSSAIVAPRSAKVPDNVIAAAIGAGLPPSSASSFVGPFLGNAPASVLFQIPGVTPAVSRDPSDPADSPRSSPQPVHRSHRRWPTHSGTSARRSSHL